MIVYKPKDCVPVEVSEIVNRDGTLANNVTFTIHYNGSEAFHEDKAQMITRRELHNRRPDWDHARITIDLPHCKIFTHLTRKTAL